VRTIVVGILYPKVRGFLGDYIQSINSQTEKNFELFLFDNHFGDTTQIISELDKSISVRIIPILEESSSIILVRKIILDVLRKEIADNIIFTDTDDFFDKHRVELMTLALETEQIVFSDIVAVDVNGNKLDRKSFLSGINEVVFEDLINKNLLGFSHTGIKWELLSHVFPYEDDLKVGDWWFFACLLSNGIKAKKIEGSVVYYRQHQANLAGMKQILTPKDLDWAMAVKISQCKCVLKYLSGEQASQVRGELDNVLTLQKKLSDSTEMENHLLFLNKLDKVFAWWECV